MHTGILRAMMTDEQRASAIETFKEVIGKANGQSALAMVLQCSQSRVSRILNGESDIEAEMAARIQAKYGVPKWRLRPDLFDAPPQKRRPRPRRAAKKKAA